jgi:hypothetical protein
MNEYPLKGLRELVTFEKMSSNSPQFCNWPYWKAKDLVNVLPKYETFGDE